MPRPRKLDLLGTGPEDVVVDATGRIITGLEDGRILRVSPDGSAVEVLAHTGGHPLGVEIDRDGTVVICDCRRGLLRLDPGNGSLVDLVSAGDVVGDLSLGLCNNSAIGRDGTIYFSDSSSRFTQPWWKADLFEHSGTGRLLRRDPNGRCEVLAGGLQFANGVALAPDETFVLVAETGAYRITRVWLSGPSAGRTDVFADNLPGFPDNLSTGTDGLLWIAVGSPRSPVLDHLLPRPPILRRALWALPPRLQPGPVDTAWVMAMTFGGELVHDLQDRVPGFFMVTGVREHCGTVYLGSLHGRAVAALELSPASSTTP